MVHIYAPAGCYILSPNCLAWFDLTGWYETQGILWRNKYERHACFIKRARKFVASSKHGSKILPLKKAIKLSMQNIRRQWKIEKQMEKNKGVNHGNTNAD